MYSVSWTNILWKRGLGVTRRPLASRDAPFRENFIFFLFVDPWNLFISILVLSKLTYDVVLTLGDYGEPSDGDQANVQEPNTTFEASAMF